jgi:predicted phage terminase large subunit-like protein
MSVDKLAAKLVCEDSLLDFTRYLFQKQTNNPFQVNYHHAVIAEALEQLVNGCLPDGARNLLINMPPRYGKTQLAVICFVAWCLARNPQAKFIHLSYADKLALDNSSQIREFMREASYKELWPIEWKQDADAKGLWKTTQGGGLMASPAGGTITGFGAGSTELGGYGKDFAGAVIIDDPLKPDDADSEIARSAINERLVNTIMSRRNSRETPIILIMQRLHEDDMTGFVLSGRTGEKWHHLKLPALKEDGSALWSQKHTSEELKLIQSASPYMFAGQYQQEPAPLEGEYFKRDWFRFYDELPKGLEYYGASDYAVTENGGDWTVHGLFGVDKSGDIYVVDWWRQRAPSNVWVDSFLSMCADWKPNIWAEENGQIIKAVGPYIEQRMKERNIYVYRKQFASASDKSTRGRSIQARISARGIYLPKGKDWVEPLISECLVFPNGKNDDQVDVLSKFGQLLADTVITSSIVNTDSTVYRDFNYGSNGWMGG